MTPILAYVFYPSQELRGSWWIAGQREARIVPGGLSLDSRSRSQLDLDEALLVRWLPDGGGYAVGPEPATAHAIHGRTRLGRVTLVNPYAWTETVYAAAVIVGAWIGGDDTKDQQTIDEQPIFHRIEIELEDLGEWTGASTVTRALKAPRREGDRIVSYREPASLRADLPDGTDISIQWQTTSERESSRGRRAVSASERVAIHLRPTSPASLNQLLEHAQTLRHLVSFACGRDVAVIAQRLRCTGTYAGTREDVSVDLHVPQVRPAEVDAKSMDPRDLLFTAADATFSALVPAWFEKFKRLRGPILALGGARDHNAAGENRLLNAATAAEQLHYRLDPTARALPLDEFDRLKNAIMAAVSADESLERYADWARERITNTPSLEQRLVALPDLLPDQGQQLLAGGQDQNVLDLHRAAWAWATRKGRNDIAHRGITTALDSDAAYATILTTAAVAELVVLTELGFDDAHLANVTGRRFDDIPSRIQERLVPLYQQALATR